MFKRKAGEGTGIGDPINATNDYNQREFLRKTFVFSSFLFSPYLTRKKHVGAAYPFSLVDTHTHTRSRASRVSEETVSVETEKHGTASKSIGRLHKALAAAITTATATTGLRWLPNKQFDDTPETYTHTQSKRVGHLAETERNNDKITSIPSK